MANIQSGAAVPLTPSGRLFLLATQENLVSGVETIVELANIDPDFKDGVEDTGQHKIVPGVAGFYFVSGQVTFSSVVADKKYWAQIKTSVGFVRRGCAVPGSGDLCSVPVFGLMWLSATEYVLLRAKSEAGVDTVDVQGGSSLTFLELQRVR